MTYEELVEMWLERDALYARLKYDLGQDAIESVRLWRQKEAGMVEPTHRAEMFMEASRWTPPPRIIR